MQYISNLCDQERDQFINILPIPLCRLMNAVRAKALADLAWAVPRSAPFVRTLTNTFCCRMVVAMTIAPLLVRISMISLMSKSTALQSK